MQRNDLTTPALLVDADAFAHNVATMTAARPGPALRPHVKAFKSTALARRLAEAGHRSFCCATIREAEGMAGAGLGEDLLLANEVIDARRLGVLVEAGAARVTVAVDSDTTIRAAARGGVREVLIDVNNGFRCGCEPEDAGPLADLARSLGLEVRGVMGYEGHVSLNPDRQTRIELLEVAMARLARAYADVGGDVVSGAGTGTYDLNTLVTEVQAGSYTLMDTEYAKLGLPFQQALHLWATVISVNDRVAICDAGLKSHAMDHGDPSIDGADVLYCSDEHVVFVPHEGRSWQVGDRVRLTPAHVDPTIALHERLWLVDGDEVVDEWPVDLRGW
jgi:D-serine deaminase-like pyridoxal phosphate-dependent protein